MKCHLEMKFVAFCSFCPCSLIVVLRGRQQKNESVLNILVYFLEQFQRFSRRYPKMFSTDFIFWQKENLVDNQKCQAGFRPLCNKIIQLLLKCLIFPFSWLCYIIWKWKGKIGTSMQEIRWRVSIDYIICWKLHSN